MAERTRSSILLDGGRQGFVYVLTSRLLRTPDGVPLLKIGCTRKHPLQRAKELASGTGVAEAYQIAYYRDFSDCFIAERLTHHHFAAQRLHDDREFFAAPLDEVVFFLDGLVNSSTYRGLASEGVTGGERQGEAPIATPFAELFATFDQDGPAELTAAEQAQCRALEGSL